MLDAAPRLKLIGELEGDRFANRIDVEAAAERGIRVVDTTHGSSLPVAEWALALMLIGLRNAGAAVPPADRRRGVPPLARTTPGYRLGELTGQTVGLIGLGPHRPAPDRAAGAVPLPGPGPRPVRAEGAGAGDAASQLTSLEQVMADAGRGGLHGAADARSTQRHDRRRASSTC